ncbi:hypothetical protein LZ31DRAFT_299519 [Colletotrichum somersetense]|nr:hypothetical protein LZ31DRAFT_299519 [Colletotrichum somersetense]
MACANVAVVPGVSLSLSLSLVRANERDSLKCPVTTISRFDAMPDRTDRSPLRGTMVQYGRFGTYTGASPAPAPPGLSASSGRRFVEGNTIGCGRCKCSVLFAVDFLFLFCFFFFSSFFSMLDKATKYLTHCEGAGAEHVRKRKGAWSCFYFYLGHELV